MTSACAFRSLSNSKPATNTPTVSGLPTEKATSRRRCHCHHCGKVNAISVKTRRPPHRISCGASVGLYRAMKYVTPKNSAPAKNGIRNECQSWTIHKTHKLTITTTPNAIMTSRQTIPRALEILRASETHKIQAKINHAENANAHVLGRPRLVRTAQAA